MTVEQLQAQVAAKMEEVANKVKEQYEVSRLTAKLELLNNDSLQRLKVMQMRTASTSDKLKSLEMMCEAVVNEMPIYNSRTRETRKWNPSRQYGLGNHVALLTGILSGIQYSASEHKVQMLAITGLSEDLIEATLESFGQTAFYSKNYQEVVEGTPYNLAAILDNLMLIEEALDITLDKATLNNKHMQSKFTTARLKAERNASEDALALKLNDQLLTIE